ncbi:NADH-quinone oxidoreductase subunit E [Bradyrhizobium sp. ISRA443]|uniref:complex I subunit 5 family protein n=1 Tax=unclassified Bradyrhizobium TaxID=2631580 RepID=UPI0024788EA7|nr:MULTISPECIES: proton-conducting transporter membrane subunit [unclassified Bradyrhizobium]WGR93113.1 NADH-quinone oxidoreductase subunit E [Bradyrhizobium sp. ISRA435]WGR97622.1 NADH-quinone oxidoreductase subunit E [Bradyrhizobium sp. ISRA436]WGS04512.1 NADH-quinone oxidoreductase subunit E [Bradyrhizobium sp. ISRA437]WGS11393.1 NADH-quinone oxidoreductase subunit E [Bradyrhizobium sp. ISRA443]
MLLVGRFLPWRLPDGIATVTALATFGLTVAIAIGTARAPFVYWFGNWSPRGDIVVGIGFVAGQADAAVAALTALMFAASFVFAWGYFEDIRAFFHVLMLLFLGAMEGFCLTHDLFNLFVWFEVMSVVAFALTAYRLESSALEGALNFTITNTLGSFLMLGGIGLLYLRAGALDFGALSRSIASSPHDPVALAAFCLLATALLIKGAMVPFQFWLADAHAVAPSPVSVLFSGAMVPLGVFGIAKLYWEIFSPAPAISHVVQTLLLGMGAASAIMGGLGCLRQRHMKRLLAFSTISHTGMLLGGIALLTPEGLGGMLAYLIGHGLVKGALFMIAGVLLARLGGIDELGLRGRGRTRRMMPVGIAMAVAGLLLAGAPIGLLAEGAHLLDKAASSGANGWVLSALLIGPASTGAAVLRATGRVFLGWGEAAGEEERGPSEEEREKANRPLWLMMLPILLLLALALVCGGESVGRHAIRAALRFIAWDGRASLGAVPALPPMPGDSLAHPLLPWLSMGFALVIAGHDLARDRLPGLWLRVTDRTLRPLLALIDGLHDGVVGDYVAWIVVGLAAFSLTFAVVGG